MNQIVMANIKLPIYVNNDGSLEPMTEYITIQIEECKELPEKNNENNKSLMDEIHNILSSVNKPPEPEPEPNIMISIEEILEKRQKKTRNNLSLKKNSKNIHKYTMKNR